MWHFIYLLLGPGALLANSMLLDAESIGQKFAPQIIKISPPSNLPQTASLLDVSSVWFTIDLNSLQAPKDSSLLRELAQEDFWNILSDLGVDGLYLENLKTGGSFQTALGIDPKWGCKEWPKLTQAAEMRGIALIGDALGSATGKGKDFELALKKVDDYSELYHLIEIDPSDWNLLPNIALGKGVANISWLQLRELYKKGYISEQSQPYIKQSNWNATKKINGSDGITRRWIYLKENQNNPVLSWLSPSFVAQKLASGDALYRIFGLNQKIGRVDAKLPGIAKEMQSLWMRKIGGFTVQKDTQTLGGVKNSFADVVIDTFTQSALLHALIAEDTQVLKLIYRLFLENKIQPMHLVHILQPFDSFACDWTEFAMNPKKKYLYFEEKITGELLRQKLLTEDLLKLKTPKMEKLPLSTWAGYCALAPSVMKIKDFQKSQEKLQQAHELLCLTYAMQPGIFSFSAADILGALPEEAKSLDLLGPNPKTLYPALMFQLQNPHSFGSHLKKMLFLRKNLSIAKGELLSVPSTTAPSSFLLVHRLPQSKSIQLLALNFGSETVQEIVEIDAIKETLAIELLSSLIQEKDLSSSRFTFTIPPLSGKVFLFQPKYFN
jgi:trehalose synthase